MIKYLFKALKIKLTSWSRKERYHLSPHFKFLRTKTSINSKTSILTKRLGKSISWSNLNGSIKWLKMREITSKLNQKSPSRTATTLLKTMLLWSISWRKRFIRSSFHFLIIKTLATQISGETLVPMILILMSLTDLKISFISKSNLLGKSSSCLLIASFEKRWSQW